MHLFQFPLSPLISNGESLLAQIPWSYNENILLVALLPKLCACELSEWSFSGSKTTLFSSFSSQETLSLSQFVFFFSIQLFFVLLLRKRCAPTPVPLFNLRVFIGSCKDPIFMLKVSKLLKINSSLTICVSYNFTSPNPWGPKQNCSDNEKS